jgi:spore coat protein U domain-containing protein, fimbrial subunit CupE1/2/3/6
MNVRQTLRQFSIVPLSAALCMAPMHAALAGSSTGNLNIQAEIANDCVITAATWDLGSYDPVNANLVNALHVASTIGLICTLNAAVTVTVTQGAHAGGGSSDAAPVRRMAGTTTPANLLPYNLYSDNAYSQVWQGPTGTGISYTGSGTAQTIAIYASVPGGTNLPADTYTDLVVVTCNY